MPMHSSWLLTRLEKNVAKQTCKIISILQWFRTGLLGEIGLALFRHRGVKLCRPSHRSHFLPINPSDGLNTGSTALHFPATVWQNHCTESDKLILRTETIPLFRCDSNLLVTLYIRSYNRSRIPATIPLVTVNCHQVTSKLESQRNNGIISAHVGGCQKSIKSFLCGMNVDKHGSRLLRCFATFCRCLLIL